MDVSVVMYTLGIYAAIVMSPGPNFALVSKLALQGRSNATHGAIVGLASAATFYAVLAMFGLAAFLTNFSWAVRLIQIGGGLYLVYLGVQSWRTQKTSIVHDKTESDDSRGKHEFLHGLNIGGIVCLSNPKGIAFFIGLYAVAIPLDATSSTRIAVLAGGIVIELFWYNIVAHFLSRPLIRHLYDRARKLIDRVIGSLLIVVGGNMIFDR